MNIDNIARAFELKNLLDIAQARLERMEEKSASTAPQSIIFVSDEGRALIDTDDLDGGVWYAAIEVVIKNLKDQIARYKEAISNL